MVSANRSRLKGLARLFLKLGFFAFGGPAAHIAMMEDEVVNRRRWITRQHFLDLVGATNLIPGPNSTEMTMHVGYEQGGVKGMFVSGSCFILPAVSMTGVLAWLYMTYGTLPAVAPFLAGIKPAVLAIIAGALWRLGKKAVKGWRYILPAGVTFGFLWYGIDEVLSLLVGGLIGALWLKISEEISVKTTALLLWLHLPALVGSVRVAEEVTLWKLGLFFLKVGAILYGSGYVLVAFLEGTLVQDTGWLTQQQLLDAIAIGQFTPGPVLSTATFVGFLIAGPTGAAIATVCIFLPSFVFVAILNPLIPKLRKSAWASAFLDAVNVAALTLMFWVLLKLGQAALVSWETWLIAVGALLLLLQFKLNSIWLIVFGALLGYLVV